MSAPSFHTTDWFDGFVKSRGRGWTCRRARAFAAWRENYSDFAENGGRSICSLEASCLECRQHQHRYRLPTTRFVVPYTGSSEMKARSCIAACTLVLILCNFQGVALGQNVVPEAGGSVVKSSLATWDLALQRGGVLDGRVISVDGRALANAEVAVFREGQHVGSDQTSGGGKFQLPGLRPGVYQVVTPNGHGQYRVWALGTAPPNALPVAQIVDGSAQSGVVHQRGWNRGWVIGSLAAAGVIGGTIAIIDHNNNSPGS
jgi:hypothetical protein